MIIRGKENWKPLLPVLRVESIWSLIYLWSKPARINPPACAWMRGSAGDYTQQAAFHTLKRSWYATRTAHPHTVSRFDFMEHKSPRQRSYSKNAPPVYYIIPIRIYFVKKDWTICTSIKAQCWSIHAQRLWKPSQPRIIAIFFWSNRYTAPWGNQNVTRLQISLSR